MAKTRAKKQKKASRQGGGRKKKQKFPSMKGVAYGLRLLRKNRDITQSELAELAGVARGYISNTENQFAGYEMPTGLLKKIFKICTREEKELLLECVHNEIDHHVL